MATSTRAALAKPFWNTSEQRIRAVWRLLLQFLLMVPLALAFGYVLSPAAGPTAGYILAYLFAITGSIGLAGRFLDRRRFADFGLHPGRSWWKDLSFGLALGVLLIGAVFVTEWALGWLTVTAIIQDQDPAMPFPVLFIGTALLFTSVGFYEELLSRGYHVKNMAEGLNGAPFSPRAAIWVALLISSVLFGLGHAVNPNATLVSTVNIMFAGVFLGLGYVLTGELALSIGLHISWNFAQGALFGFPVSGSTRFSTAQVFAIRQGGPPLWTGGAFGPEAGLLGLLAMAAGAVLIITWVRSRYGTKGAKVALARAPLPGDV